MGKNLMNREEDRTDSYMTFTFSTETPEISNRYFDKYSYAETIEEEEPLSLQAKEIEMIKQALIRSNGKRKLLQKNWVSQNEHFTEKLNNMISMKLNKII